MEQSDLGAIFLLTISFNDGGYLWNFSVYLGVTTNALTGGEVYGAVGHGASWIKPSELPRQLVHQHRGCVVYVADLQSLFNPHNQDES